MEDLNRQIQSILSDPNQMQQLQSMAAALGLTGGASDTNAPEPPAPAAPTEPEISPQNALFPSGGLSPEMLQMAGKLAPVLSQLNREDDATRLLRALRPLLSQPRRQKLDEAIKILQMMRLLPLLKNSGFGSLFF